MTNKPKKPKTRAKTFSEVANAVDRYEETGDFRWVVLAIGYHPNNFPKWAISACREYYERWELNHKTIISAKRWLMPKDEQFGSSLNEMADHIIQQHLNTEKGDWETTVHKAAAYIASRKNKDSPILINPLVQRLIRAWSKEAPDPRTMPPDEWPHISDHPRIVRKYVPLIKNGAFTSKKS